MTTDLLTAAQAAERAGVNRRTILRWAETGRLSVALTLPGETGAHLFRPADVDAVTAEATA
jgi:excisionase family DNA binding protein